MHDQGYLNEGRAFKLFTFSQLNGSYTIRRKTKRILFNGDITWQISSVAVNFIQELGNGFLVGSPLTFNQQLVHVTEMQCIPLQINKRKCHIKMLSPLTVHRTYETIDGKKRTHFITPYDPVFADMVFDNLRRKYEAYYQRKAMNDFRIHPVNVSKREKVVARYKNNFFITGYMGHYRLESDPELLTFAAAVGLGSRNSAGFGMFEIVEED